MAINASQITISQTLEEFRLEFNKLQGDVEILKDNPTFTNQLVFEGDTADAFETTLTVTDPTADRIVTLPNASGTLFLNGQSALSVANGGTIGSASATDSMTIAANGVITFSQRNVNSAGITIQDGGEIGSASATDAMTISSAGIVTFKDDIVLKDAATIGVASSTSAITIASTGIITFVDDIILKDAATIGVASSTSAITIASTGIVSFIDDITIKDGGTIGSASDVDAITIASDGVVTFSQSPIFANDLTIEDDLLLDSDGAIIKLGEDGDVTLTHVADTGILLNSTMAIQFNDASQFINAPSATILDINATDEIELNATLVDLNGTLNVSGDTTLLADLELQHDAAVLKFGVNDDVTLTHVHDTGLLLNSTMAIQFNDASQFINAPSATILDINATDEIELNATLVDINANVEISGTAAITGIATFTDDIVIGDGKTIGSASAPYAITIASDGIVSFAGSITIKDSGTIGTATDADSITIAAAGAVTLSQRSVHSGGITLANDGQIGSASDTDAIAISSAGVVTLSATAASSSKTTGALVVAGGIGTSADLYVGDLLNVEGGINIAGSNQELRFYEGANYVGFEAPDLSANQIWVLPAVDASNSGDVLMSNASGTLSWSTAVSGVATNFAVTANNTANETVFPLFVDGATGAQGAETDTGFTYNPSTGILTSAKLLVADNGTIGSASAVSAMTISSGGVVTFVDDIIIKDGGTIGSASDTDSITIDSSGNVTFSQNIVVTGSTTLNGALVLGDAAADTLTIGATIAGASPLVFEGGSANAHETTFAITDPTGDRTITFPDQTGTVHTSGGSITIPDAGTIGSASDTNAIGISSGGVVSITATTASTSKTSGALTVAGGLGVSLDAAIGDDLFMISDGAVITFGANSEIALTHVHDVGLQMTSTVYAPLSRRGEDVFIVLDGTDAAGTANAGDNIIMDASAAGTDVGDDIIGEDEVFLHSGMQRNVINIKGSNGQILNSVAGFAPGAI
jgi:hypothetical protein